jgi:cytochrome c oxidase subunit 1
MAFPRLNALGFWLTLFGGLLTYLSFATGGAPAIGWFAYAPLTERTFARSAATDLWALGLIVSGVGTTTAGINFVATILGMRAPGMALWKIPFFTWTMLWTSVLILFAMTPLTAGLAMVLLDRNLGAHFFDVQNGGSALLWQHLFWFFGHPEVYILVLPVFGMVSEIIPVFSRKVLFGYPFMAAATAAIAFISLGVWAHHMFTVGMSRAADLFFVVSTFLVSIPTGIKFFNWLGTMWRGTVTLNTATLYVLGFMMMFLFGGITGVILAQPLLDFQLHNTYFIVAHFHYVMFGGSAFAAFAGIYYWYPKFTGRLLHEGLGKLSFLLMFVGFNLTFFPQHTLGLRGMPRRIETYPSTLGWNWLNMWSSIGAYILGIGVAVTVVNLFVSYRSGKIAGDNPWDGQTLEWACSSPPPDHNFEALPPIRSERPVWDANHPDELTRVGH